MGVKKECGQDIHESVSDPVLPEPGYARALVVDQNSRVPAWIKIHAGSGRVYREKDGVLISMSGIASSERVLATSG